MALALHVFIPAPFANASPVEIIYTFTGGSDGKYPNAIKSASDGSFYGFTSEGGTPSDAPSSGGGTIFKLSADAKTFSTLYTFSQGDFNFVGFHPKLLIEGGDGYLYGATDQARENPSGTNAAGAVFAISPLGVASQIHLVFNQDISGIAYGRTGNFYTATTVGYTSSGGEIYRDPGAAPSSGSLIPGSTTLAAFTDGDSIAGGLPVALFQPTGDDFTIYGLTTNGGANGTGTLFSVSRQGVVTVWASIPTGMRAWKIFEVKGTMFVAAHPVSVSDVDHTDVIYRLDPTGLTPFATTPYQITDLTVGADDILYGISGSGGVFNAPNAGTVAFKIGADGTVSVVADFGLDGSAHAPTSVAQGLDGNLYGTTLYNGGYGCIFRVNLKQPTGYLGVNFMPGNFGIEQWRVDGGDWHNNDANLVSLSPGNHTVSFIPIFGEITPPDQVVTITAGELTTATGTYVDAPVDPTPSPTPTSTPSATPKPVQTTAPAKLKLSAVVPATVRSSKLTITGQFVGGKGRQSIYLFAPLDERLIAFPGKTWKISVKLRPGKNSISLQPVDASGVPGKILLIKVVRK